MLIAYVLCLYFYACYSYEIIAQLKNPSDQMNDTLWKEKKDNNRNNDTHKIKWKEKFALRHSALHCTYWRVEMACNKDSIIIYAYFVINILRFASFFHSIPFIQSFCMWRGASFIFFCLTITFCVLNLHLTQSPVQTYYLNKSLNE